MLSEYRGVYQHGKKTNSPSVSADRHQGRAIGNHDGSSPEGNEMFMLEIAERPGDRLACRSQACGNLLMRQGHSDLICLLLFIRRPVQEEAGQLLMGGG
jgi:hypothetical protein